MSDQGILDIFHMERALTPQERRRLAVKTKKTGHAARPGTGPPGETCGSCEHLVRKHLAKTYIKCGLTRAVWTRSCRTDVRVRDQACSKWQQEEPDHER
jgi:hypothetical protein